MPAQPPTPRAWLRLAVDVAIRCVPLDAVRLPSAAVRSLPVRAVLASAVLGLALVACDDGERAGSADGSEGAPALQRPEERGGTVEVRPPSDGASDRTARRTRLRPGDAPGPRGTVAPVPVPAPDSAAAGDTLRPGVRGRVAVDEVGIGGVEVRLQTADGRTVRTRTSEGRRDRRGFFGFASVPPGVHHLALELPDPSGVEVPDTVVPVEVASLQQVTRIDFPARLRPASTVAGAVRDRSGEPVEGARIEVSGDALEVHRSPLAPVLGSLSWRGSALTGPDGRYALEAPPGRYRIRVWRPDWLEGLRFLRVQYRSPTATAAAGDTVRADFDFGDFEAGDCTVRSLRYGAVVTRDFGEMLCAEALHPTVTFAETWTFRGSAGDRVEISTDLDAADPLLLAGPDSTLVASAGDRPDGDPSTSTLRARLERDGTYVIVVTQDRPRWKYSAPYTLELGLAADVPTAERADRSTGASGSSRGGPEDPLR